MGRAYSNRFRFTVTGLPNFSPPYSLPGPGEVVAIGTNNPRDISPTPAQGMADPSYYLTAVFLAYGGGAVVPDYSLGGAFVIDSSGGHASPDNVGAAIFDYTDASWKRRDPADGPNYYRTFAYNDTGGETTGSPFYEVTGTTIPAPGHPYNNLVWVPKTKDGSNKGSVMRMGAGAVTFQSHSMFAMHKFDLETGVYNRPVTGTIGGDVLNGVGLYDADRGRWWHLASDELNYHGIYYVDAADWTVKVSGGYGFPITQWAAGGAFMYQGLIIRNSSYGPALACYDPDIPAGAPFLLNVDVAANLNPMDGCLYAPFHGKFYSVPETSGNTADYTFLYRLTPPASSPKTNQWIADRVTIPAIPSTGVGNSGGSISYNRFHYVPSIDRLSWIPGWIPGVNKGTFLIYPN